MKLFTLLFITTLCFAHYDPYTGLNIEKYQTTLFQAKLSTNNLQRTYTSIDSVILDMKNYGIKDIEVIDFKHLIFIPANQAHFVYKSNIKPTYGKYSLIAFKKYSDASSHIKEFKGTILQFNEILKIAKKELQSNYKFMQKRYKKRAFSMGEKIYTKICPQDIEWSEFIEINDLQEFLLEEEPCGTLETEHLKALGLYLWFIKRNGELGIVEGKLEVREDEKCPVCGMFTYKYPKWVAQIYYIHDDHEHRFSFDGVKDMMKFYFEPRKWGKYSYINKKSISKILVTDYYSNKGIDAFKAFYVIRSDIYGPMGHELIPFETYEDAEIFKNEHRGKRILRFEEITKELPYELDISM